jgi:hypothetical protein
MSPLMNKPKFTSRSIGPFILFCVGFALYFIGAIHLLRATPLDVLMVVVYFSTGFVLLAALYITSCTYDVYDSHIVQKRAFGLLGSQDFRLSTLCKVSLKTDYTRGVSAATLEFESGRRLRLNKFQGNFLDMIHLLRQKHAQKFDESI